MRYLIFVFLLTIAGCTQPQSAEQTLSRYLELSDAGRHQEFGEILAGEAMDAAMQANEILEELELIQSGETEFFDLKQTGDNSWSFCLDVSNTKIFDKSGSDLTPTNRPGQLPMTMTLESFGSSKKITELEIRRLQGC